MKNLQKLIKQATSNEDGNKHITLTGDELLSLVKNRRVKVFKLGTQFERFDSPEAKSYYTGHGHLTITRSQAIKVAQDFKEYETGRDGQQLYYQVYVSSWNTYKENSNDLYINL